MARREADDHLTETFKVFRITRVLNETTGAYTDTEVPVYAAIKGRVKFPSLTVRERAQGAQVPAVQDILIKVKVGTAVNVAVNDVWRCTASEADSSLVGQTYRTKGEPQAGTVSNHRFPVESVA